MNDEILKMITSTHKHTDTGQKKKQLSRDNKSTLNAVISLIFE